MGLSPVIDEPAFIQNVEASLRSFSAAREIVDGAHRLKIAGHRSIPFWAPRKQRLLGPHRPSSDLYEPVTTAVMSFLLRSFPISRVFDVGGASGYFNFVAASSDSANAEVHAFEMRPDWFAQAQERLKNEAWCEGRVFNHLAGVSDQHLGPRKIWYSKTDMYEAEPAASEYREAWWRRLKRGLKGGADVAKLKSKEVEVTSLDALAAKLGAPGLIKLDVDGYEAKAIYGGASVFSANPRPFLLFELHKNERLKRFGRSRRDIMSWLFEKGYHALAFSDPDDCARTRVQPVTPASPEIDAERTSLFLLY